MRVLGSAALIVALLVSSCAEPSESMPEATMPSGSIVDGSVQRFEETLAGFRGRPAVVNFWASWCEPCKRELPLLVSAATEFGASVAFLGVIVQDDVEAARGFIDRYQIPYPHLTDPRKSILESENGVGPPVTQFYRADGELAFNHNGEITSAEMLQGRIEELIRLGQPVQAPS